MKAALRVTALEYSQIDLSPEEISACKKHGGSDSLLESMCNLVRKVIR
ncbi:hypothetical protein [Methanolobus chelungpuianus]|nr:hypothetical protein [Methanolobus chelungpuianus]